MRTVFLISSIIALVSTALAISRPKAIHALLFLVLSLLSLSVVFATVGAPLAAGLEIIVYAGAIMVLFLFAVMLLNLEAPQQIVAGGRARIPAWIVAGAMGAALVAELTSAILTQRSAAGAPVAVHAPAVGASLFGPYLIAVELASFLLLVGLVGAYHLGRQGPDAEASS